MNDQSNASLHGPTPGQSGLTRPFDGLVVSRRQALGGGLLAGAFLLASQGCESQQKVEINQGDGVLPNPNQLPAERPPQVVLAPPPSPMPTPVQPIGTPPGVMLRSRWTRANTIAALANPMNGINRMTIHHTAVVSTDIRSEADAIRQLNSVRNSHLKRGWADIGYHYVIDPQGRIWEGRPTSWQGAHVEDTNEHNLGICVLGNFDRQTPTPAALASLDSFIVDSARRYRIPLNRVYTHRELKPTECPGTSLQRYMVATRGGGGRVRSALA